MTLVEGTDYTVTWPSDTTSTGTKTVKFTGKGNYQGTATAQFTIAPAELAMGDISLDPTSATYNGKDQTPAITVEKLGSKLKAGSDYEVSWTTAERVAAGTYQVSVTGKGNFTGTQKLTFAVDKLDISSVNAAPIPNQVWTGAAVEPAVKLGDLAEGKDFTVSYSNNIEVGTAKAIVSGIGSCEGSTEIIFQITRDISGLELKLPEGPFEYTGSGIEPEVTIEGLSSDDFTVSFKDNVEPGKASIIVKGSGNYSGELEASFQIVRDVSTLEASLNANNFTHDGTAKKPTVTIPGLKEGTDFEVTYSNNIAVGTATATVTGKGNYHGNITLNYTIAERPSKTDSDADANSNSTPVTIGGKTVNFGSLPDAATTEKSITTAKSDADPKDSSFGLLQAKATKVSKKNIKIAWTKISGATSYTVYGNKCGKKNKYVKLKTLSKKSFTLKGLKKGTYHKFLVVATKTIGKKTKTLAVSKTIHAATKGGKVGNPTKVTTKAKKNKVSIKKGKSFKLSAKFVSPKKLKVKKHRGIKYETSNASVATVSSKGVIKGKKKGACYVYAYAQNGVFAKVKVTIK